VSHVAGNGTTTLCYKDRREGDVVLETLSPFLGRLFQMCNGALKTSEIIVRLGRQFPETEDTPDTVTQALRRWTHSRCQLLKLLPRPKEAYDMVGLPPYAVSTMPYPLLRESPNKPPEVSGTRDYHKLEITSADEQFDVKETTLSHALRVPHPALGGRTYGAALARALVDRDFLPDAPSERFRAAEVGGGTGFFAKAFVDGLALRAPRLFNRLRYTIVDLAPALRASQRERTAVHADKIKLVGGDAERLPFADASLDFVVSNEVIADLPVAQVRREELEDDAVQGGPGADAVRKYGLPWKNAPGLFFVNLGAFHFVEECARVLKPGGTAIMTEYGSHTEFPRQSTHLDHPEFSIQFSHLKQVAGQLGLETSLEYLPSLLDLDETVKVLETTQSFFEALRAFLGTRDIKLEKIAYTEDMFTELLGDKLRLRDLQGLKFTPCGNRVLGLKPREFKALMIRKPRSEGRAVKKISLDL
jgi:ubiquinone/menaquinone biosynthesis C-methylase UbiE